MITSVHGKPLRILSLVGDAAALKLPADLASHVEVVSVPRDATIPADLTGDVMIMGFGNPAMYDLAERGVRWIHFVGTGVDWMDIKRLANNRLFTTARGSVSVPIAEWALAMLLFHAKQLGSIFIHQPPEKWPVRTQLGSLQDAHVALLGFGTIGTAIAQRVLPFGAKLRVLRGSNAPSPIAGVTMVKDIHQLIDGADHLILAAPLTDKTRHIVSSEVLSRVKPGLHIVNIARGELIDQDALRQALDDGRVGAASLDAVTPEPTPAGHWLYSHPKVRLSPHISWSAPQTTDAAQRIFHDNLKRYLQGEPLENVIDPARGY